MKRLLILLTVVQLCLTVGIRPADGQHDISSARDDRSDSEQCVQLLAVEVESEEDAGREGRDRTVVATLERAAGSRLPSGCRRAVLPDARDVQRHGRARCLTARAPPRRA
ncbi:MAG: hypothetical protein KC503_41175 [Myxococcales bacterium]|nr:hypothetical protein [Myxococcales bacterium]